MNLYDYKRLREHQFVPTSATLLGCNGITCFLKMELENTDGWASLVFCVEEELVKQITGYQHEFALQHYMMLPDWGHCLDGLCGIPVEQTVHDMPLNGATLYDAFSTNE